MTEAERAREYREAFDERAGILEYDGGLSREEAEKKAREIVGPPPVAERTS